MIIVAILITLLLIILTALFFGYTYYFQVQAKADEWMLVLRNGQVVKSGIGISYTRYINDQIITFPSRIHQVKFTAQQITQENQGIEVSGVIIWTIFRDGDGPFKAYNNLGEDLKKPSPDYANSTFREMINSIVRHRIANSKINEIVTKRDEVRTEIKKQMNHLLNKWGVWLESVEITDVKVLSGTLFANMQVEFREEMRKKAEQIQLRTQEQINEQKRQVQYENDKKKLEMATQTEIRRLEEQLKIKNQNQKFIEKENEFKKQNIDSTNELDRYAQQKAHEFELFKMNLEKAKKIEQENNEIEISKKIEEKELQDVLKKIALKKKTLEINQLQHEQNLRHVKETGELNNKLQQSLSLDSQVLNTVQNIYKAMPLKQVKMINYNQSGKDPVTDLITRVASSIQDLKKN